MKIMKKTEIIKSKQVDYIENSNKNIIKDRTSNCNNTWRITQDKRNIYLALKLINVDELFI